MKKRLFLAFILAAYIVIVIKVMILRDVPTIRIGHLMLNFGGADANGHANFVPFTTIVSYLFDSKGWIIAGVNLVGNILPLVPIGFMTPFVYPNMTWKKSLVIALFSGLAIETMQAVLGLGIFDIDDVILNAFGVMIGYWTWGTLAKWLRLKNYKNVLILAIIIIAAAAMVLYAIYPWGQPVSVGKQ